MFSVILFIVANIVGIGIIYRFFGLFREKDISLRETLFWSILFVFSCEVTFGFILALLGVYSLWLVSVLVLTAAMAGAVVIYICKRRGKTSQRFKGDTLLKHMNYGLLVLLIVIGVLYNIYPTYYMWARRDPAIYLINGINIAQTGSIRLPDNELIDKQYKEIEDFVYLSYRGIYSEYEEGDSVIPSKVTSQFLHFFPVALALGYSVAGLAGLVRVNAIIGILCILMVYYFCKRVFDRKTATIAVILLAINPAQLWCVRITQTEILFQLFVFAGLYLFWMAWKRGKAEYAVGAGLLLGFTGLNRMDSYILGVGIFCLACYANLWLREHKKITNILAISYGVAALVSLAYSYQFSKYYVVSHWKAGVLSAIVNCNLLLAAFVGITYFLGRQGWIAKHNPIRYVVDEENRRAGFFVVSILVFAIIYMLRPLLQTGKNPDWDFNQRALVELFWYVSVIAVPLFFYGLWEIAGEVQRRKEVLLFLAIGLSNFLVYIYKPAVASDHLWASRRWVSVVFPFILIVVAWGVSRLSRILRLNEKVVGRLCSVLVVLLAGYAVYQDRLFLFEPMLSELPGQYDELEEQLDDNTLYIAEQSHFASILRFVYGKNVVVLKENSSKEIYNYLQGDNRAVFYIGNIGAIKGELNRTCLYEHELKGTYINQTVGEYPSEIMKIGGATNIYRIEAVDDAIDIGQGMWAERTVGLERMHFMEGAVKLEDGYKSDENAGYFMYGPYWHLREGNYYVEFELEAEKSLTNQSIGFVEVTCDAGQVILEQRMLKYGELDQGAVRIDFSVDQDMDYVEFRVYKNKGCIVKIRGINYGFEGR